ncbi:MAG: hypothetical protein K6E92_05920 [Lachnospiraceae bacterium]|nr:hypothetical protein [Lachnospiraceae bacterium]
MSNNSPEKTHLPEGVFAAFKKDGTPYFRASLTHRTKHISLGSFADPEQAHLAYLEGRKLLENPSLTLTLYNENRELSFEKWVVLLNFRDNGLYFSTPIYIGQKVIFYYLSPTEVLKFDPDDLFYYSSHKISRRGGHLFVADYGSQLSLPARYGIKAYAVEGRDFRFLNRDPFDYRRENLEILNIYHGVIRTGKGFVARIHLRSYYRIGIYEDAITAAIAYNKAVDILRAAGFEKNFPVNDIDEISPRVYAEIYSAIRTAPAIIRLRP